MMVSSTTKKNIALPDEITPSTIRACVNFQLLVMLSTFKDGCLVNDNNAVNFSQRQYTELSHQALITWSMSF